MSTDFHTPHPEGAPLSSDELNAPLAELDAAIGQLDLNFTVVRCTADGATDNAARIQAAADAATAGMTIYIITDDPTQAIAIGSTVTFSVAGTKLVGVNSGAGNSLGCKFIALNNLGANSLFEWKMAAGGDQHEGAGAEGFIVDMNNKTGHGITVYRAYNSSAWRNVRVRNVADAYSAWRFMPHPSASSSQLVSQGIYCEGIWGQHYADTSTAPTILLDNVQESTFVACKGWGGAGTVEAGHWPWQVQNCRGVQFYGCSAAASGKGGWNIIPTRRQVQSITIDSPTFELIGLSPTRASYVRTGPPESTATWSAATTYAVDDVVVYPAGGDCYVSIQAGINQQPDTATTYWTKIDVTRTTVRAIRFQTPVFAEFDIDISTNGYLETGSSIVVLSDNSDTNYVVSERNDLVTMGAGLGNFLIGRPFFQSGKAYAPFIRVTNPGISALTSAIYLGSGTLIGTGTGSPESVITAPVGSIFMRTDNANSFYVKQTGTGNTGWVLK